MRDSLFEPTALLALDDARIDRLRGSVALGFDAGLIARAEAIAPRQFDALRLPLVHAWLRGEAGHAPIWARLFAYRDSVAREHAEAALGLELLDALRSIGAVIETEAGLRTRLRLLPFADLLLATDEVDAHPDPVMGPGATTLELWRALAVEPGVRVLDIGCGAGSLALAAARVGASSVVGVDLDARAVEYARFNARLNGIADARFLAGDLAAPVAGQRFDLIVSQPPFVTRPPTLAATTYLHGGHRGDELCLRMLGQLPALLGEQGRALVLFDSADDAELMDRITASLAGAGSGDAPLRTIVVTAPGMSADAQALGYAAAANVALGPDYAATAIAYREHLRTIGIERTVHVLLDVSVVEAGRPRFAARVEPRNAGVPTAGELAELRAGLDAAARPDAALLQLPVQVNPHALLVHERRLAGDGDERLIVRFDGGRGRERELSPAAAALLELIAQTPSLDAALARYAEACEAGVEDVASGVAGFVRESLVNGLLITAC